MHILKATELYTLNGWILFKKKKGGRFQGLQLGAFTARSGGSIPGQETKVPQAQLWAQQQRQKAIKKSNDRTSLVVQWLRLHPSASRKGLGWVPFGAIRSYMPCSVAKKLKIRKKIKGNQREVGWQERKLTLTKHTPQASAFLIIWFATRTLSKVPC